MASYLLSGVSTAGKILVHPITSLLGTISEEKSYSDLDEPLPEYGYDNNMTLEGTLGYRKGGGTGKSLTWGRRYVVLDMTDGGSLSCYRLNQPKPILRKMYTQLHHQIRSGPKGHHGTQPTHSKDVVLYLPPNAPWIVKDIPESSSLFVVEVATHDSTCFHFEDDREDCVSIAEASFATNDFDEDPSINGDLSVLTHDKRSSLERALQKAKKKNKPLRFYFRCPRKGNEKALWLGALTRIRRLSSEPSHKKRPLSALSQVLVGDSRIRSEISGLFARETRQLDQLDRGGLTESTHELLEKSDLDDSPRRAPTGRTEFRVSPAYAYPHVWFTKEELLAEMNPPSSHFHDLRLPAKHGDEIGTLRVEVLQCLGLPNLDRKSETDAVCYFVCGSYAFATDVIKDCLNPVWPRKSRRGCVFPIYDGFARLYAGVFDDDRYQDDFVGRVVLDLARLRPGSVYDVVLPLRLSAHVYSRRKRGSIRLRFELNWKSERAALLSYLPKKLKIPRNLKPRENVTVLCTDETSFQNVALTVHGAHPPGRFSVSHFRANLREINFTRKAMMIILRRTIRETRTWKRPVVSLLVFLAWMHCVYENRFSLVPAYIVSFILLLLIRNYAKYGIDGSLQNGFLPPTWEEMCLAIIHDTDTNEARHQIEPLELHNTRGRTTIPSSTATDSLHMPPLAAPDNDFSPRENINYITTTHKPKGKRFFRFLGFLGNVEDVPDHTHLEFPFAKGEDYPQFTVEESLVPKPQKKTKEPRRRKSQNRRKNQQDTTKVRADTNDIPNRPRLSSDVLVPHDMEELFTIDDDLAGETDETDDSTSPTTDLQIGPRVRPAQSHLSRSYSHDDLDEDLGLSERGSTSFEEPQLPPHLILPEQDIDKEGVSTGNKLTDDLGEIKEKMHELTFHLFNDRAYAVKDPKALYFGHGTKAVSRKPDYNVSRYLDKGLGIRQYSHGNPIIARIALYLEPIIGSSLSFLCAFRALFNVFTWRDPFLSFWVSIFAAALAMLLFVFPWRIFLFVAGVAIVGPQNWLLRVLRERGTIPAPKWSSGEDETALTTEELLHQQLVFQGHAPREQKLRPIDLSSVNTREVHHVVVPYSPLMYQRSYDWPPEPQYAKVKKESTHSVRRVMHIRSASEGGGAHEGLQRIMLSRSRSYSDSPSRLDLSRSSSADSRLTPPRNTPPRHALTKKMN